MSAKTINLMPAPVTRVSDFGLPENAGFLVLQGKDKVQHLLIFYDGPASDLPATVPNGSWLFRHSASGNAMIGSKVGTIGLTDGSWKVQAVNT